jgi:hypothetical protein
MVVVEEVEEEAEDWKMEEQEIEKRWRQAQPQPGPAGGC